MFQSREAAVSLATRGRWQRRFLQRRAPLAHTVTALPVCGRDLRSMRREPTPRNAQTVRRRAKPQRVADADVCGPGRRSSESLPRSRVTSLQNASSRVAARYPQLVLRLWRAPRSGALDRMRRSRCPKAQRCALRQADSTTWCSGWPATSRVACEGTAPLPPHHWCPGTRRSGCMTSESKGLLEATLVHLAMVQRLATRGAERRGPAAAHARTSCAAAAPERLARELLQVVGCAPSVAPATADGSAPVTRGWGGAHLPFCCRPAWCARRGAPRPSSFRRA